MSKIKNEEHLGKEAKPEHRGSIKMFAPKSCIGACVECGDYMRLYV